MGPHCNYPNQKCPFSHKNMMKVQKSQNTYPQNVAILLLLVRFITHTDVFSGQKDIFQILHFSPIVFPIKTLKMVARPQFLSKYSIFLTVGCTNQAYTLSTHSLNCHNLQWPIPECLPFKKNIYCDRNCGLATIFKVLIGNTMGESAKSRKCRYDLKIHQYES